MSKEAIERSIERMKLLKSGKTIQCPYCKEGQIKKVNDISFLCDKCGKGIVGRVNVNS